MILLLLTWSLALTAGHPAIMDHLPSTPAGYRFVEHPPSYQLLQMGVAVTLPTLDQFERDLLDISTPGHPRYGHHMSMEELGAYFKPRDDAAMAIISWLKGAGVEEEGIVDNRGWINFEASVETVEDLLSTRFGVYREEISEMDFVRTLEYSVPAEIQRYIRMVQPTTRFNQIKPHRSHIQRIDTFDQSAVSDVDNGGCNSTISPLCLRDLYHVSDYSLTNLTGTGFAAFNDFLQEFPRYEDLAAFQVEYADYTIGANFTSTSIASGLLAQTLDGNTSEANLDVQYLLSGSYPVPIHTYSTGGLGLVIPSLDEPNANNSMNEPYLVFLNYMLALPDEQLPHTLSTSYGEDEHTVPLQYRLTVCNMFAQLGARGVSVIFSSGDLGPGGACQLNDGTNRTRFGPIFPATCPWVTSVGGTYQVNPEFAAPFSSGGFSDTWARPSYQDAVVSEYLDTQLPSGQWEGLYNRSGRAFPDVAAQAHNYRIIDKGQQTLISGTSCAAPTFAAVIALINSLRIQAGKPGLGFLNPWLYGIGYQGLTDIVNGGSIGCTGTDPLSGLQTPTVPFASWNATPGWDPVTGLGTPNFQKLLQLAMMENTTQASGSHSWRSAPLDSRQRHESFIWKVMAVALATALPIALA